MATEPALEKLSSNKTFEGELIKYKFKVSRLILSADPRVLLSFRYFVLSQLLLVASILNLISTYHQPHHRRKFLSSSTLQA
jgi:hypothetical protein